jgi:arginine N-succinyltransferase
VDIFDAGPVLEGETDAIRAVRASRVLPVRHRDPATGGGALCIVANQHFEDFRALLIEADADAAALDLTGPMIDALHLADGDAARLVSLLPEELPA